MLSLDQKEPCWSLGDLSFDLGLTFGLDISRQALDQRFNSSSVQFFKSLLSELLPGLLEIGLEDHTKEFGRILIKDSTCFQLPSHLSTHYKGSGGGGSEACIRIQFEYNLLQSEVTELSLHPFNVQDIKHASESLGKVQPKDLLIRDLGYIKTKVLAQIDHGKAYFLNRLPQAPNIYYQDQKRDQILKLDLGKLYQMMCKNQIQSLQKTILMGQELFETQLWVELVPDEVYAQRIRKAQYTAQKKGQKLTQRKKNYARFNLFLTNIPTKVLPLASIRKIYRIRWQVELIFKSWKSYAYLDQLGSMKRYRFETLIYMRLIRIILVTNLARSCIILYRDREASNKLSFLKTFKVLIQHFDFLIKLSLLKELNAHQESLILLKLIEKKCRFEGKKNRCSSYQVEQLLFRFARSNK